MTKSNSDVLPDKKLFIFGYGYTAAFLVAALKRDPKANWTIAATTRDRDKLEQLRALGIKAYLHTDTGGLGDPLGVLKNTTHVLVSTPPDDLGCPVYNVLEDFIAQVPTIEWLGYLSATSVYGSRDGAWVNEEAEVRPISKRGSRRVKAERQWLGACEDYGLPAHIFRLTGIYGPRRSGLDAVRAGRSRRIRKEGHVFNRIHVEDIAQSLLLSMSKPNSCAIYNISDDLPAPSWEVITHASELVGVEPQPIIDFEDADLAPITRSFYADNKRVCNKRMKEELGVILKYPSYKEGLAQCLASEDMEDEALINAGFNVVMNRD